AAGKSSASIPVNAATAPRSREDAPTAIATTMLTSCKPSPAQTAGEKRALPGSSPLPTQYATPVTTSGGMASKSNNDGNAAATRFDDNEPSHVPSTSVAGTTTAAAPSPAKYS